jgi:parallel beta-helix repeat protein
MKNLFLLTAFFGLFFSYASAVDLYVALNGSDSAGSGTVARPWRTIQKALDEASTASASALANIHVASGTYYGNFTLIPYVSLYGGYQPDTWIRELALYPTTICAASANILDKTITAADHSTIDGFTITLGFFGIYCLDASPTISSNTIKNNSSFAIWCSLNSAPTITGNTISNNKGGIYCISTGSPYPIIYNNTITDHTDHGIYCEDSSPAIEQNTLKRNNLSGIYCSHSSPSILRNYILRNLGDGIACYSSSPLITNNMIARNQRGIYCHTATQPNIQNNTICANSASGVACRAASPTLINNIIAMNRYYGLEEVYTQSTPTVLYNCFFQNEDGDYLDAGTTVSIGALQINSRVINDPNPCEDNIDGDPVFASPFNDDFHLAYGSSCIDAGTVTVLTDIDGDSRPYDIPGIDNNGPLPEFDIGADEFINRFSFSFDSSTEQWEYGNVEPYFSAPTSIYTNGSLGLQSVDHWTFGYWTSPPNSIPILPDEFYRTTWTVTSDLDEPSLIPSFRLRWNNENFQSSGFVLVDSALAGENSPTRSGKTYETYFLPIQGKSASLQLPSSMIAAFDMLNFIQDNSPDATVFLDSIVFERTMIPYFDDAWTTVTTYDFDGSTEGWSFVSVPGIFDVPISGRSRSALAITTQNTRNTFGYWLSPIIPVEQDHLYRAQFSVATNVSDQALVPSIRFRFNLVNNHMAAALNIESSGNGTSSPVSTEYTTYQLFFAPPSNAAADGMVIAFDVLGFVPDDQANSTLLLDSVRIYKAPLPLF